VRTIADGDFAAGIHTITFDAENLSSGTYVCKLEAGGFTQSRLMVVAR